MKWLVWALLVAFSSGLAVEAPGAGAAPSPSNPGLDAARGLLAQHAGLARDEQGLAADVPKEPAGAKGSPAPGLKGESDPKSVVDPEAMERERSVEAAKVQRTQGEIRTLAVAMEAFAVDNHEYPSGTLDVLEKLLSPAYVRVMPRADAWGTPYRVEVTKDRQNYRVTSAGADRTFEKRGPVGCPEDEGGLVQPSDPRRDTVFYNGRFVQQVK